LISSNGLFELRSPNKTFGLVFEAAVNEQWVLLFEGGDALFGSRGQVADAHHRYDDEGTYYFNELVEHYRGTIIISVTASNNINPLIFEK
jgi:hypothetical protein